MFKTLDNEKDKLPNRTVEKVAKQFAYSALFGRMGRSEFGHLTKTRRRKEMSDGKAKQLDEVQIKAILLHKKSTQRSLQFQHGVCKSHPTKYQ